MPKDSLNSELTRYFTVNPIMGSLLKSSSILPQLGLVSASTLTMAIVEVNFVTIIV